MGCYPLTSSAGPNRVYPHTTTRHFRLPSAMPLLGVVLTLIVVGVVLWLINSFIPMQGTIKTILNLVVVIAVIRWLLHGFGVINNSGEIHLPVVK
jgi:predicted membrane protein